MASSHPTGWSSQDLAGHPCDLFQPATSRAAGQVILYLHDLEGRPPQDQPGLKQPLEQAGLPVIAPRGDVSWWLGKILTPFDSALTAEAYLLGPVLEACRQWFAASPTGIGLLGTEMGGQGVLQLAYRHPDRFPVAAALGPAIDFHQGMRLGHEWPDGERFASLWEMFGDVEEARQETALLHIHPLNWPRHQWFASDPQDLRWHDGAVRLTSKLTALGIPHTAILERPVETDLVTTFAEEAITFLCRALQAESRRLTSSA